MRDLGSRNGTFVAGERLRAPERKKLHAGDVVCFGHEEVAWVLFDNAAPPVMAVPLAGGDPAIMEGQLLALPSGDDPRVTLYRGPDGSWLSESQDEGTETVHNGQTFEVAGRQWRFWCPESVAQTATILDASASRAVRLKFAVSRDEEHVALSASVAGSLLDLGTRSHNYLLLTLARHRLSDQKAGLPDTSCGWIYQDELLRALDVSGQQLNIDVFRIRKQLAELGFPDPAGIVERRPRTRQLRLGSDQIEIDSCRLFGEQNLRVGPGGLIKPGAAA